MPGYWYKKMKNIRLSEKNIEHIEKYRLIDKKNQKYQYIGKSN